MSEVSDNSWTLAFVCVGVLLLYSLSRIIALHRRLRDLEARPPVDDIVMRGMIRQQVSELLTHLEKRTDVSKPEPVEKIKKTESPPVLSNPLPEEPTPPPELELKENLPEVKKTTKKKSKKTL